MFWIRLSIRATSPMGLPDAMIASAIGWTTKGKRGRAVEEELRVWWARATFLNTASRRKRVRDGRHCWKSGCSRGTALGVPPWMLGRLAIAITTTTTVGGLEQ